MIQIKPIILLLALSINLQANEREWAELSKEVNQQFAHIDGNCVFVAIELNRRLQEAGYTKWRVHKLFFKNKLTGHWIVTNGTMAMDNNRSGLVWPVSRVGEHGGQTWSIMTYIYPKEIIEKRAARRTKNGR